jgi:hypothetical protein
MVVLCCEANTERNPSSGVVLHFAPEPLGVVGWFVVGEHARTENQTQVQAGACSCQIIHAGCWLLAGWCFPGTKQTENIGAADSTFPVSRDSHMKIAKME